MKFTISWLKEYLDTDKSNKEILDALLNIGLEVEEVINYPELFKDFTVAEVLKAEKHPNADKLRVCEVKTINGIKQVVCGAPNARAGIKVIFAKEGSYIPGTNITLKKTSIRGVESCGMMTSEFELCISNEHDGIIEVNQEFNIGDSAAVALGLNDIVIDVAITANLAYLLSVKGIAKELAAYGIGKFKPKQVSNIQILSNKKIDLKVNKEISNSFAVRIIEDVKNISSPVWVQNRLKMIGQKPISALVDITNYLRVELNHPMHVYDFNKIGNSINVDYTNKTTKFLALNGNEYELPIGTPVVSDNNQEVGAVAGIIGGIELSSSENTTNVVLECAHFNSDIVRNCRKQLNISTDSSYYFERNVDQTTIIEALEQATDLIISICGGKASEINNVVTAEPVVKTIKVSVKRVNDILGTNISKDAILKYLENLDFKIISNNSNSIEVEVPSYRYDVEGEHSIVEEIMKIYGINNIPTLNINKENFFVKAYKGNFETAIKAKRSLAMQGLFETFNMSFISEELAKTFNIYNEELKLLNPISKELAVMRSSLIPSLLLTVLKNSNKGYKDLLLFEVANVFSSLDKEDQFLNAAGVLSGYKYSKSWQYGNVLFNTFDAKEKLFTLINDISINPSNLLVSKEKLPSYYHPTKSGTVWIGKKHLANFGEIHPTIIKELGIKNNNIVVFELLINNLPVSKSKNSTLLPLVEISEFMPLTRDFAFLTSSKVKAFEIIRLIKSVNKQLIKDVKVFDIFESDSPNMGHSEYTKSIAVSVLIEPVQKTLVEEEINGISNKIISIVENSLDAVLRKS